MGKEGLRYRFSHLLESKEWTMVSSFKISNVVDAAGSGDWFSAGIISKIAANGTSGFKTCNEETILKALQFGQALGALNCFFEGARGLMYALDKEQLNDFIKKIHSSKTPFTFMNEKEDLKPIKEFNIRSLY